MSVAEVNRIGNRHVVDLGGVPWFGESWADAAGGTGNKRILPARHGAFVTDTKPGVPHTRHSSRTR